MICTNIVLPQRPESYQQEPPGLQTYEPQDSEPNFERSQNFSINPQSCTVAEIKGYAAAMQDFIQPGQGLSWQQTQTILGMILGITVPKPIEVIRNTPEQPGRGNPAQEHLMSIDQSNNNFNRGRRPAGAQLINEPKRPLKQKHLQDPNELRRLQQFDMDWQMSQKGVPDAAGQRELAPSKYPY